MIIPFTLFSFRQFPDLIRAPLYPMYSLSENPSIYDKIEGHQSSGTSRSQHKRGYLHLKATLEMPTRRVDAESAIHDVTIIGGGPVGLFGAFYAGLRQMKCQIIDSLPELGGQLSTLYPEKYVYDMPGFPKILARDLAEQMIEQ